MTADRSARDPRHEHRDNAWSCFVVGLLICAVLLALVHAIDVMG